MESEAIKNHRIVNLLPSGPVAANKMAINQSSKAFARVKIIPKADFPPYTNFYAITKQFEVQRSFSKSKYLSRVLDSHEDEKNLFIFTEYHNDAFLSEMLTKEGFSEGKSLLIVIDILQGLKALHENNAMHSNLKPGNIQKRGQRFVLEDWGIWAISALTDLKENSINYRAPEIINNEIFDDKVDIWALGAILFEMLTGKKLFAGSSPEKTKAKIMKFDSLDFDNYKVKISAECKDLLQRMLQPNPMDRISWVEITEHQVFKRKEVNLEGFDQELKIYDIKNVNLRSTCRFYQEINKAKGNNIKTSIAMSNNPLSIRASQNNDFMDDDICFGEEDDLSDDEASKKKKQKTENLSELKAEAEQKLEELNKTEKVIQGLEKRYLFVRNMMIFISKIASQIIKKGNGFIPIIWIFVVCLKKVHLAYKNLHPNKIKQNPFNFQEIKTLSFFKQSHFFKEFLILLSEDFEHIEIVIQSHIMDLNDLNEEEKKNFVNVFNYLTEVQEGQNDLFLTLAKYFLQKKDAYLQALVKNGNNLSREDAELYLAFFLDCLKWEEVFKFDEEQAVGFNLEDYDKSLRSQKQEIISKKIQEDCEELIKRDRILELDFGFLEYK